MAPTIHLVRHAQGHHNISAQSQHLHDPQLTPLGEQECVTLRDSFTGHDQITHLVASPLRRTLSTCLLAFAPVIASSSSSPDKDPAVIIALPDAQELSLYDCDRGTHVAVLKDEYNGQREVVDFTLVPDDWSAKFHPDRHPNVDNLVARARRVRLWLRDLAARAGGEDVQIVLVTHGGFLHFLTEDWDGIPPRKGTGWANCELRTYEFADASGLDPNASLKETQTSWQRRRGADVPLTRDQQLELRAAYSKTLDAETVMVMRELREMEIAAAAERSR